MRINQKYSYNYHSRLFNILKEIIRNILISPISTIIKINKITNVYIYKPNSVRVLYYSQRNTRK